MDCNSYSYTPYMCDESPIMEYSNDDMYVEIYKARSYSRIYYDVYACSYDGSLEAADRFDSLEIAKKFYDYIVENFSNTPPAAGEIEAYIEDLKKGFIHIESLVY